MDINHLLEREQLLLLRARFAVLREARQHHLAAARGFGERLRATAFPHRHVTEACVG